MKCRVTTLGGDKEYGVEKTVAELDDIGPIYLRELQIPLDTELTHILAEPAVERVELEAESMAGYDAHLTVVCDQNL